MHVWSAAVRLINTGVSLQRYCVVVVPAHTTVPDSVLHMNYGKGLTRRQKLTEEGRWGRGTRQGNHHHPPAWFRSELLSSGSRDFRRKELESFRGLRSTWFQIKAKIGTTAVVAKKLEKFGGRTQRFSDEPMARGGSRSHLRSVLLVYGTRDYRVGVDQSHHILVHDGSGGKKVKNTLKETRHNTHLREQTADTWCRTCRLASMLYVLTKGGTATHLSWGNEMQQRKVLF